MIKKITHIEIEKLALYLALRNGKAKALGIKLLLFGAKNVGKTCVAASLVGDPFEECNQFYTRCRHSDMQCH